MNPSILNTMKPQPRASRCRPSANQTGLQQATSHCHKNQDLAGGLMILGGLAGNTAIMAGILGSAYINLPRGIITTALRLTAAVICKRTWKISAQAGQDLRQARAAASKT